MNEYEAIFADVRDVDDLRRAIAHAVRTLRSAMDKEDNRAVTSAHVRNLEEITPAALACAYATAERQCTFWPSPGEIRSLAGWSEETNARGALGWVFRYLEGHGAEGRARGGGVHFGENDAGQRVLIETTPVVPAPPLPSEIETALRLLTCGSVKDGLRYLCQHPVIRGWNEFAGDSGARAADRIEARWIRSYQQTLANLRRMS